MVEAEQEPRSRTDEAYFAIRRMLVLLEIAPGAVISEPALCERLELGRTPVREALKRLENDHLVQSFPRRGTFATTVDIRELAEITEIRLALEPVAVERAAERLSPATRAALLEVVDELEAIPDDADPFSLMRLDLDVHRAIYAASGSSHLADLLERYSLLATRIWCLAIDRMPDVVGHVRSHLVVLEAILHGDGAAARTRVREHIERFEREIRHVL